MIEILTCKRCGESWTPKSDKIPVQCARCHSTLWNKDRKSRVRPPRMNSADLMEMQNQMFDQLAEKSRAANPKLFAFRDIVRQCGLTHEVICEKLPVSIEKLQAALSGEITLTDEQLKVIREKLPPVDNGVF